MSYIPPQEILEKYADVLVNFALNSGEGVRRGEVVFLEIPECAKPILIPLQKAILKSGAHYITQFLPDDVSRHFYELAEEHQLEFFPDKLLKGKVEQADHSIGILAETNKKELEGINPKKIMQRSKAFKPYKEWREEKENAGNYTWTLALYGTPAMAKEASLSEEAYWQQIINACYLNSENPVDENKKVFARIEELKLKLNSMKIEKIKIKSKDIDLIVGIGKNRKWLGGSGRNIPSFEIFISPDFRKTNGRIFFNQPLYRYGNLISGIYLEFKDGKIIKSGAEKNESVLKEMIGSDEGSNFIGEFSLTDSRFSKINKFMAETLYDENFGGEHGNMHIAIGSAYKDSYPNEKEIPKISKEKWNEMGYNDSIVHSDIINSEKKEVFAILENGKEILIYKDGKFVI